MRALRGWKKLKGQEASIEVSDPYPILDVDADVGGFFSRAGKTCPTQTPTPGPGRGKVGFLEMRGFLRLKTVSTLPVSGTDSFCELGPGPRPRPGVGLTQAGRQSPISTMVPVEIRKCNLTHARIDARLPGPAPGAPSCKVFSDLSVNRNLPGGYPFDRDADRAKGAGVDVADENADQGGLGSQSQRYCQGQ